MRWREGKDEEERRGETIERERKKLVYRKQETHRALRRG